MGPNTVSGWMKERKSIAALCVFLGVSGASAVKLAHPHEAPSDPRCPLGVWAMRLYCRDAEEDAEKRCYERVREWTIDKRSKTQSTTVRQFLHLAGDKHSIESKCLIDRLPATLPQSCSTSDLPKSRYGVRHRTDRRL